MIAIIFGGSSGIGKVIAKKFKENGYVVYICSRNPEKAAIEIGADKFFSADITEELEVRKVARSIDCNIDVLVNSVGDLIPKSLNKLTLEEWNYSFKINTTPTFLLYKYFVSKMNKKSFWFNISSEWGLKPRADNAAYSISKSALNILTKLMGEELEPHIFVNAIAPSRTNTPLRKKTYRKEPKNLLLNPEEIANCIFAIVQNKVRIYSQILEVRLGKLEQKKFEEFIKRKRYK